MAEGFVKELADRAGADSVVDFEWGVALGIMLALGWRVESPTDED